MEQIEIWNCGEEMSTQEDSETDNQVEAEKKKKKASFYK